MLIIFESRQKKKIGVEREREKREMALCLMKCALWHRLAEKENERLTKSEEIFFSILFDWLSPKLRKSSRVGMSSGESIEVDFKAIFEQERWNKTYRHYCKVIVFFDCCVHTRGHQI